ncbi:hypothetical protein BDZ97DRAFT_184805 [Flammula alnicola]|nr:hypothetical protein BDZ97DRAFT_184805 [Flammula alnicola]
MKSTIHHKILRLACIMRLGLLSHKAALQSVQCIIKFFNEQVLAVSDVEDPAVAEEAESDIARLKTQRTTKHTRCKD